MRLTSQLIGRPSMGKAWFCSLLVHAAALAAAQFCWTVPLQRVSLAGQRNAIHIEAAFSEPQPRQAAEVQIELEPQPDAQRGQHEPVPLEIALRLTTEPVVPTRTEPAQRREIPRAAEERPQPEAVPPATAQRDQPLRVLPTRAEPDPRGVAEQAPREPAPRAEPPREPLLTALLEPDSRPPMPREAEQQPPEPVPPAVAPREPRAPVVPSVSEPGTRRPVSRAAELPEAASAAAAAAEQKAAQGAAAAQPDPSPRTLPPTRQQTTVEAARPADPQSVREPAPARDEAPRVAAPPRRAPGSADPKPSPTAVKQPQRVVKKPSPQSTVAVQQAAGVEEQQPDFAGNRPPPYPPEAIRLRQEGTVLLRLHIADTGRIARVEVARSSGHAVLDRAAVDAVRKWRGRPARRGGQPVATVELLPIRFILRR